MSADVFVATTERALGLLGEVRRAAAAHSPTAGVREVADEVCRAIGAVCEARDAQRDPLSAIEAAQAHVALACAHLGTTTSVSFASPLAEALGELMTASRFAPQAVPRQCSPERMSQGVPHQAQHNHTIALPRAHALPLPPNPLTPVQAASGPDRVAALLAKLPRESARSVPEAASDESTEPPELPDGGSEDEIISLLAGEHVDPLIPEEDARAFTVRWARDLFDEMAALGMQRMPLKDDDVWGRAFVEDRLLAALDAFVGLGDAALHSLEDFSADAPAPEPWHLFVIGLVAGTVGGRDLAFLLESALHDQDALDPEVANAWEAAHRLVCSPAMQTMLRSLLQSNRPTLRSFGLLGLAASDSATTEELLELARGEDPRLLGLALRALGRRGVEHAVPIALATFSRAPKDPALQLACCKTLLVLRSPALLEVLRKPLSEDACEWAGLIAGISGDPALASELHAVTRASPTVGRALGLGWAGRVEALPLLLALLEGEEDVAEAAARSLARILGEAPIEERDIAPEKLAEPDLVEPAAVALFEGRPPRPKSAQELTEDAEQAEGSPDRISTFSRDRTQWEPLVESARTRLSRTSRVRHGQVYAAHRSLAELLARDVPVPPTPDERQWAYEELLAHSQVALPFDPETWVSVQAEQLEAIRVALGAE